MTDDDYRNIKSKLSLDGAFSYPSDIVDDSPFIMIGAYPYQTMTNASDYRNRIMNRSPQSGYESVFSFFIPKGLKYSYNPQINSVRALVDDKLVEGFKTSNYKTMIKGAIATGGNFLALDQNGSMLGTGLTAMKDWRQITKGQIMDTKQMNMFTDAPFMTYTLNYKIIPESLDEAFILNRMIRLLRWLSAAKQGTTQSVKNFLGIDAKIADTEIKLGEAAKQSDVVNQITKDAQDYVNACAIIDADTTLTEGQKAGKKSNIALNKPIQTADSTINSKYKDLATVAKTLDIKANNNIPSKKSDEDGILDKLKAAWEEYKLTPKESIDAVLNMTFDIWNVPHIFDMYLISPQTKTSTTSTSPDIVSASSAHEHDMFKYAKGLLMSSLNISFIESANRDDVPWCEYGLPVGWDLEMTFTSITKHVIPSGGTI
jgi:hypothetical protein